MTLTNKQKRFVEEYLVDLNASQAAIRAGYSPKTAHEQSYQLIRKTSVAAAIKDAMQKRSQRTELTQDMVLNELRSIAFTRLSDVAEWGDGIEGLKLKSVNEISADAMPAISLIRENKRGGLGVEMHNKVQALTLLGKHLGMFADRTEITGKDGGAIELSDSERASRLAALVATAQTRKAESDAGSNS